jgi:hypothetical protein
MAYSFEPRQNDPKQDPPDSKQNSQTRSISTYDPEFARPLLSNPKDRKAVYLLALVIILIGIGICSYLVVDIGNGLRAMQTLQTEYQQLREARDRALMLEERLYALIKDISTLSEHNSLALAIQEEFGIVIEGSDTHNRLNQSYPINRLQGDFGGVDVINPNHPSQSPTTPLTQLTTQKPFKPSTETTTTTQQSKQ